MSKIRVLYISIFVYFLKGSIIMAVPELASDNIRFSSDITMQVKGKYYVDEDVVSAGKYVAGVLFDSQAIGVPHGVEIDALLVYSNRIVFSTDIGFKADSLVYANEDLVLLDIVSGQLSMFFDGSTYGIKPAANLDAIAASGVLPEKFYTSFDITIDLAGVGIVTDDDIVVFENGIFSSVIKGTDLGIPAPADIDALYFDNNILYFSLDITAEIDGNTGTDDDVWALDMGTSNVTLVGDVGIDIRADLISLDQPIDSDGDWLTDFEEYSGIDEVSSTILGTTTPISPNGYITLPMVSDTDGDGVSDGLEAIYGTDPTNPNDFPDLSGSIMIIQ